MLEHGLDAASQEDELSQLKARHGDWTAMSIYLGDGRYTRAPAPDWRLRRILQVASDLLGRPLAGARALDLACLEGQYGIELALHGAEVVGMEVREANLAKARYAQRKLGLENITFLREDVRQLSRARHGTFDLVICSGILYHLDAPDVFEFARRLYDVTDKLLILDTQIALTPRETIHHEGRTYHGLWYREHDEGADEQTKYGDYWASIDNVRSLWLTHPSLCNLMRDVGFSSFLRVETPTMPETASDRATYVAVKGRPVEVRSSPPTEALSDAPRPEHDSAPPNPAQRERSRVFRFLKHTLPQPVKDVLKTGLRAVRIMEPDATPDFVRENRRRKQKPS